MFSSQSKNSQITFYRDKNQKAPQELHLTGLKTLNYFFFTSSLSRLPGLPPTVQSAL